MFGTFQPRSRRSRRRCALTWTRVALRDPTRRTPCTCASSCARQDRRPARSPGRPAMDPAPPWSANGSAHWTIPLPNPFGVEVENRTLSFNARKYADGSVSGRFEYHQVVEGEAFVFNVDVTCMNVYDGNRAKIGGVIEVSNDPTLPPGVAWFQVFDNGEGANAPPDRSSLIGFGARPRTKRSATARTSPLRALGRPGNVQVRG